MAENRVIGLNNALPWHLPEDFRWFKQTTAGGVLVMGRRTYEAIGRPLPNRETLVLSRQALPPLPSPSAPTTQTAPDGHTLVRYICDVEELSARLKDESRNVWVCGGAEIYRQLLPCCSDLYLTHVQMQPKGDAWFPPFEHLFNDVGVVLEKPGFSVRHYRNLNPIPIH